MAQPDFVPVDPSRTVRPAERLPAPDRWEATRPGELAGLRPPDGPGFGRSGPDQGFGLKLAKRFADRLQLEPGEHAQDAVSGCLAVGLKRSALFGRAPVIHDFELAFTLFGFLGDAPRDLREFRRPYFAEAGHDYWAQRAIADLVPDETVHLTPAEVRARLPEWRSMLWFDPAEA